MTICPECGMIYKDPPLRCAECKYQFQKSNFESTLKEREIRFNCSECGNAITIKTIDTYNMFVCDECKAVFSYSWENNGFLIKLIRNGNRSNGSNNSNQSNDSSDMQSLIKFFDLEPPVDKSKLKKKYYAMLSQYHPDKVSHLGEEFKKIAEEKTKEINKNYSELCALIG